MRTPVAPPAAEVPHQFARDVVLDSMVLHERILTPARLERHGHDRASMRIIFSGEMVDRTGGAAEVLRAGDVLFHPPRIVHETAVVSRCHMLLIEFERRFTGEMSRIYASTPVSTRATTEALGGIPARIERELWTGDRLSPIFLEALVLELLGVAARVVLHPPLAPPRWLRDALDYIQSCHAQRLTASAIARRAGVSERTLRTAFREHRLGSFTQYLRAVRVAAAVELLTTSADLGAIAAACGFYDGAHFAHAFKAVKGMSPTEYRRMLRSRAS